MVWVSGRSPWIFDPISLRTDPVHDAVHGDLCVAQGRFALWEGPAHLPDIDVQIFWEIEIDGQSVFFFCLTPEKKSRRTAVQSVSIIPPYTSILPAYGWEGMFQALPQAPYSGS